MTSGRLRSTRRERVYEYICTHIAEYNRPPSYREIMDECGYKSMAGVQFQLKRLETEGLITRAPNTARGIELMNRIPAHDYLLLESARTVVQAWNEGNMGPAIRRLAEVVAIYDESQRFPST